MITIQLLTKRYNEGTATTVDLEPRTKGGGVNESFEDIRSLNVELNVELGEDRIDRFPPTESFTAVVVEALLTERQLANQQQVITAPEEESIVSDPSFPVGGLHVLRRYENNEYYLKNLAYFYRETTRKNPQSAPILALKKSHP